MSGFAAFGWFLTSAVVAAPPPPKVETPGTFLCLEHIHQEKGKFGTVLLDEKGKILRYLDPYALSGVRSPDGRRLACVEVDEEADPNSFSALRLVLRSLVEKEEPVFLPLKLGQSGSSSFFVWSATGRRLFVQESRNDRQKGRKDYLRIYDLDAKKFTDMSLPIDYYVTGWSSDGTKLLAMSPSRRICWLNVNGSGNPDYLTPDSEVSYDARLTSDDKWILYQTGPIPPKGERANLRLTAMELATKKRFVLDDPGETYGYCWSKDNTRVAFTWQKSVPKETPATDFETILYTCDRDGKNRTVVTSRKLKTSRPAGGTIIFFDVHDWK
jgi:hypothetical protein